ncbi:MAG: tail fiber domain-containing protein [Tenuifilaceae bacterium]
MKARIFSLGLVTIIIASFIQNAFAQVPETFSYQVIVRDGSNNPIANRSVRFRITLQNDNGSTVYFTETHSATTSSLGLINLNIGGGSIATGTIKGVPWKAGSVYIKVEIDPNGGTAYTLMGTSKLQTVPFALYSAKIGEVVSESTALDDDPIFVVKNKTGKIVFAVYQTGVRAYVEDSKGDKGARSGFAVGGLTNQGKTEQEYLRITPDSARIWVNSESAKGARGGFAVGGLTNKATSSNFLVLTPENYFIGHESGLKTTSGLHNSFIGYKSGFSNTAGSRNIFLGRYTGYSNIGGNQNVFIGDSTGNSNTTGFANVFLGDRSGIKNQSGFWNIFLGRRSGALNTSGYANIIIGDYAGYDNTTGYDNVIIGDWSGASNTTGENNIFLGANSGWSNTIGDDNTFIGTKSGYSNIDGSYNVFLGQNSGYSNTTALSNVILGKSAGYYNDTASYNVIIGTLAGYNNKGWQNVFLGQESGRSNTSGSFNVYSGCGAGWSNTTGQQNIINGAYAGYKNTTGGWNVFIGPLVGYNNTTGYENVFIGNRAGYSNQTGNYNVFIGDKAGYYETSSEKLYIENSDATSTGALIYGDFYNNTLRFNGNTTAIDTKTNNDDVALSGHHFVTAYYGIGLEGKGGYVGVRGIADYYSGYDYRYGVRGKGAGGNYNYGVYGEATGANYRYGVYGTATAVTGSWAGYFSGNMYYTGSLTSTSDEKLKKNIQPVLGALKKILSLNGVTYEWKSEDELASLLRARHIDSKNETKDIPAFNFSNGVQYGIIAQDLEKIIPELVQTDPDGLKSVDYIKLIPVLIEAIKEQQKQYQLLKEEFESFKARNK